MGWMGSRYSYNRFEASTLNINLRAVTFINGFLFLGHQPKGLTAEEIDPIPIAYTNNRIDVMLNAMGKGNLCVLFFYVGSRCAVGRKNVIRRATIKTVNDREPISSDTRLF